MTPPALHKSFEVRAKRTLDKFVDIIDKSAILPAVDAVVTDAAEYIVSVLAQEAIVSELGYRKFLFLKFINNKKSKSRIWFYSFKCAGCCIIWWSQVWKWENAYGSALSQIVRFISEQNDIADLVELYILIPVQVNRVNQGDKGFIAAFSSTNLNTNRLINNIQNNINYKTAKGYDELILVAVDMLWLRM